MFGRGAGGIGKTFDARQKIGANDIRQRLGGGAGKNLHYLLCYMTLFLISMENNWSESVTFWALV